MGKREPRFHSEVSEKSHKNMSRIRGKDTSIEVTLRKALWNKGYRFIENYDHPIFKCGVQLVDMIYLRKLL